MEKVWPVNYLTVENVERYRIIMSFFYQRHRQMQGTLYRPEILKMMQESYSESYSEIEVDQDLETLYTWGNVQKQQEMIRPRSIEEYRNRNFRYQISEEGILVEEMVFQLTHKKHVAVGALNEKGFRNLLRLLEEISEPGADIVELWQEIRSEFRRIGEDTANYIGYITSPEVDSRMKTEQFLIYKDKFVNYLRDFISNVQALYYRFTRLIKELPMLNFEQLVDGLLLKEQEIPTMDGVTREEIHAQLEGEMVALRTWFLGATNRPSEYDNLINQTNQMITKITSLIYYYGQEIHQYQSRKKDYLHLAKWFAEAENIDEAKKMFAGVFGLSHSRHYFVSEGSDATSTREDSWNLDAAKLYLNNRGRGTVTERRAQSFSIDTKAQEERRQAYKEKIMQQRARVESYFKNGVLDFSEIECLDNESRKTFLKWISAAVAATDPTKNILKNNAENREYDLLEQKVATELDFEIIVTISGSARVTVICEDGELEMPHVVIRRGDL